MQLNFLQEELASALQDTKPTSKNKPKPTQASAATDLFGGLPLAPAPTPVKKQVAVVETPAEEIAEKHHIEKADGAMKTISEAAEMLGVQQHVLRFWESRFAQIKPLKLRGGRRYYRPEDMLVLRKIQHLLYKQGYTIKGAIKAFSSEKSAPLPAAKPQPVGVAPKGIILTDKQRKQVSGIRQELMGLRDTLRPYLENYTAH